MNKQDITGIIGGVSLLAIAYFDAEWRPFWACAGIAILVWSIATAVQSRRRRK